MVNKPELLVPVQDWRSLKQTVGLADAIYFGVKNYNMRAQANNFERDELERVVNFCKSQDPQLKRYLCTNILIYNQELKDIENLIWEAKDAHIDAIITHDLATVKMAKKIGFPFHISTQANISNIQSALFYEELGAERIILARELSLKQIKEIKSELKNTEIECFVHGSMCTSISGRCYFSAAVTGSTDYSANRGKCVQPCRRRWRVIDDDQNELVYDGKLFLNAKDLCMIQHIPKLNEANIDAFKIEGRAKDPHYIKVVAQCYREAIDSYFEGTYGSEKINYWIEKLKKVYNRGFHTGFYFGTPGVDDIEQNIRGNVSKYKKVYLGFILSFHSASSSANIEVENPNIIVKQNDQILIEGEKTFQIEKIKKIIYAGERLNAFKKDSKEEVAKINIPVSDIVNFNDKVYIISKTKSYANFDTE